MRVQHNIMAMNAYRNYNNNTKALSGNLEKLSSGYKINRAGDDAAGLAISEKMRAQITGLDAAQKNVKDGISLVKTAEGAMQEIQDMLKRMKYLATQSANGTYDDDVDRANLQKEVDSLISEIDRIAESANFNGIALLNGTRDASGTTTGAAPAPGAAASPMETELDANDAAGVGSVTVAFADAATDEQKTALNAALKDATLSIKVTDKDNNTAVGAGDSILISGIPNGYTAKIVDASGAEVALDGTTALDFVANGTTTAGKIEAGADLTVKLYDADNNEVGSITIGEPTKAVANSDATTTVTFKEPAAAAAAAAGDTDAPTAADPGGYKVVIDTTNAIGAGKKITIGSKTYTVDVGGSGKINDGTSDIDDPDNAGNAFANAGATLADQMNAIVADYNANAGDTNFDLTFDANSGELRFTVKDGVDLANTTAPTVSTDDTNVTVGTVEKVEATDGSNAGDKNIPAGGLVLQIGDTSDAYNQLTVSIGSMKTSDFMGKAFTMTTTNGVTSYAIGTRKDGGANQTISQVDISDRSKAAVAIETITNAINYVSSVRGDLGAYQNRLDHTLNNLSTMAENIQDAESTIRDTDVAEEMMSYVKNNILVQSAQAMLAQANQVPQGVLQLLG